jgi:hypothetical protein
VVICEDFAIGGESNELCFCFFESFVATPLMAFNHEFSSGTVAEVATEAATSDVGKSVS